MITTQEFQGRINELKGKVKAKYGQLTDDDFTTASGNIDQLIGRIQQRTGQARESIEHFFETLSKKDPTSDKANHSNGGSGNGSHLEKAVHDAANYASQAAENVKEKASAFASQAADTVKEKAAAASSQAKEEFEHLVSASSQGLEEASKMVRQHPKEALLIALGVGALVGMVFGLSSRSNS